MVGVTFLYKCSNYMLLVLFSEFHFIPNYNCSNYVAPGVCFIKLSCHLMHFYNDGDLVLPSLCNIRITIANTCTQPALLFHHFSFFTPLLALCHMLETKQQHPCSIIPLKETTRRPSPYLFCYIAFADCIWMDYCLICYNFSNKQCLFFFMNAKQNIHNWRLFIQA